MYLIACLYFNLCRLRIVSSYTAQYQVLMTVRGVLHVPPWQTCPIKLHLYFSGKHPATLQLIREDHRYTHISTTTHSQVNCSRVERTNLLIVRHGSATTEPGFSCSRARSSNHRATAHKHSGFHWKHSAMLELIREE